EGLVTVADLARADPEALATRFGPRMGPWYRTLALGAGDNEVSATPYVPRSRGREVTFQENLTDWTEVTGHVRELARRVAMDVVEEGRAAQRVGVKVRYAPFVTKTRSVTLDRETSDEQDIEQAALRVLSWFDQERPVRLLGVRAEFAETTAD